MHQAWKWPRQAQEDLLRVSTWDFSQQLPLTPGGRLSDGDSQLPQG
jgi:hypothetical protein